MQNRPLSYESLWTKNLSTVKSLVTLKEALKNHFNVPAPRTRDAVIDRLEYEKKKREKIYSLVLEIDAEEKIKLPLLNFKWTHANDVYYTTFLAEIDAFTVNFDDELSLINYLLLNKEKFFSKESCEFLEDCKDLVSLSFCKMKIIVGGTRGRYDDFFDLVYSDNEYLKGFLTIKRRKKDYRPIYSRTCSQYNEYSTVESAFDRKVEWEDGFIDFAKEKLQGHHWFHNKTLRSGSIKEFCESKTVVDVSSVFQKYKNIRIASILMSEYEKEKLKKNSK